VDERELALNYKFETFYWWYVGRRKLIFDIVKKHLNKQPCGRFLETGCGTGILLEDLGEFATPFGCDISIHALRWCKQRKQGKLCQADITMLPYKDESFDFLTVLDVESGAQEKVTYDLPL